MYQIINWPMTTLKYKFNDKNKLQKRVQLELSPKHYDFPCLQLMFGYFGNQGVSTCLSTNIRQMLKSTVYTMFRLKFVHDPSLSC